MKRKIPQQRQRLMMMMMRFVKQRKNRSTGIILLIIFILYLLCFQNSSHNKPTEYHDPRSSSSIIISTKQKSNGLPSKSIISNSKLQQIHDDNNNVAVKHLQQQILKMMKQQQHHHPNNLSKSIGHMERFLQRKDHIHLVEDQHRYISQVKSTAGIQFPNLLSLNLWNDTTTNNIPTNTKLAYLHIFKSGGTTIVGQVQEYYRGRGKKGVVGQRSMEYFEQNNYLFFTLVRDPIDHFLSGWSECMYRRYPEESKAIQAMNMNKAKDAAADTTMEQNEKLQYVLYNEQIRKYLKQTKQATKEQSGYISPCETHSFPQINFLLTNHTSTTITNPNPNHNNHIFRNDLILVGELVEIESILKDILHFSKYYNSSNTGRIASENNVKSKYFPSKRNWLSNSTLIVICHFVLYDYYFFNYTLPQVCQKELSIQQRLSRMPPP